MGNGVTIQQAVANGMKFDDVEKLVRSGYFLKNFDEYQETMTTAIKTNSLDILEILTQKGNYQKLHPLHVACKYGKLEVVELLISAGQDCFSKDENGRTPLHQCCFNSSFEATLCATLLFFVSKRLARIQDATGLPPLHLAVQNGNEKVVQTLVDLGADLKQKSSDGKTAGQMAKEAGNENIMRILKKLSAEEKQKIDQERIMQIWERFFENAFKRFEQQEPLIEEEEYSYYGHEEKKRNKHEKKNVTSTSYAREAELQHEYVVRKEKKDPRKRLLQWMDWIVCYDFTAAVGNDGGEEVEQQQDVNAYYVIHKHTKETRWLSNFAREFESNTLLNLSWLALIENQLENGWNREHDALLQEFMVKPLPVTMEQAILDGWITYYDNRVNSCCWLSLPTKATETYLPLGIGEPQDLLDALSLPTNPNDTLWYGAESSCSSAWVMVVAEEQQAEDVESVWNWNNSNYELENVEKSTLYYYLNTITNHTSWEPPEGWEELVEVHWHGWTLCVHESAPSDYFWYDVMTGESAWVER